MSRQPDTGNEDGVGWDYTVLATEQALISAAEALLRAFGVTDPGMPAGELVDAAAAALVADFHFLRAQHLDGPSQDHDLTAALSIFSVLLPSRPDLVRAALHPFVRAVMADGRAGPASIAAALVDHAMVLVVAGEQLESDAIRRVAVTALTAGLAGMSDDNPRKPYLLSNLATVLKRLANPTAGDLDAAVDAAARAVRLVPDDDENLAGITGNLTDALVRKHEYTHSAAEPAAVVQIWRETAARTAALDSGRHAAVVTARCAALHDLASTLHVSYERTGDPADLESAIAIMREALDVAPSSHPTRALYQGGLAGMLCSRYDRSGDDRDLDEAIRLSQTAVAALGVGNPQRHVVLSQLARILSTHFERTGSIADLDAAVAAGEAGLAALPAGHPDYAGIQSNLGGALRSQFEVNADPDILNDAIEAGRAAVAATAADHPDRALRLLNLGISLQRRFELTGALADLRASVDATQEAVQLMPADRPSRVTALSNLGFGLRRLFERTDDLEVIDRAVRAGREAVGTSGPTDPQRPMYLSNLALSLFVRYQRDADRADLDEAITTSRDAVEAAAPGDPGRSDYLSGLGLQLRTRYEISRDPADLDGAIDAGRAAVDEQPPDAPSRAMYLNNLGVALLGKYRLDGDAAMAAAARDVMRAAARTDLAATSIRVQAARSWGVAAAALEDWPDALTAYSAAVEQLNLLAWHGLDLADRIHGLSRVPLLPGDAAAVALNAGRPEEAVVLLEQARGILLSQALLARADRDAVRAADPRLAAELDQVRSELDSVADRGTPNPAGWSASLTAQNVMQRRLELAARWDELVAAARLLPGLADFLGRPSYDDLRQAGDGSPVVIVNISQYRCDALILAAAGLRVVRLPDLTERIVADRVNALLDALEAAGRSAGGLAMASEILDRTLAWLRQEIAAPVGAALETPDTVADAPAPRLWWSPVGVAAFLPLHAVDLPRRYVCSYTPSLSALLRARARSRGATGRLLAVALPSTPRLPDLPDAETEIELLTRRVSAADTLRGPAATRERILDQLTRHSFLHFAGHGRQDPFSPESAALYCYDHVEQGPVTAADIADLHPQDAELAFLSACETARGSARLQDESLHVAGAFQLAGFRHVIATQWRISDALAPRVADQLYRRLVNSAGVPEPARVPWALDGAITAIREEGASPLLWASYIHIGP